MQKSINVLSTISTRHAQVRCQQRGISPDLLELLLEHGAERHLGDGSTIISLPRRRRERIRRCLTRTAFAAVSSHLDVYAIFNSTGTLTTVGHRFRPLYLKH